MSHSDEKQHHPAEIFFLNLIGTFFSSVLGLLAVIWALKALQIQGGGMVIWLILLFVGLIKFTIVLMRLWPKLNVALAILLGCSLAVINTFLTMQSAFLIFTIAFGS
jgi:hypothetical protein